MWNGTIATHASPLYKSSSNAAGTFVRSNVASTRQCAKSRSFQVCGMAHGRWPTSSTIAELKSRSIVVRSGMLSRLRRSLEEPFHLSSWLQHGGETQPPGRASQWEYAHRRALANEA